VAAVESGSEEVQQTALVDFQLTVLQIFKLSLEQGANVNGECDEGTALSTAIIHGDTKLVKMLDSGQFDVNLRLRRTFTTPLMLAVDLQHKEICSLLLNDPKLFK